MKRRKKLSKEADCSNSWAQKTIIEKKMLWMGFSYQVSFDVKKTIVSIRNSSHISFKYLRFWVLDHDLSTLRKIMDSRKCHFDWLHPEAQIFSQGVWKLLTTGTSKSQLSSKSSLHEAARVCILPSGVECQAPEEQSSIPHCFQGRLGGSSQYGEQIGIFQCTPSVLWKLGYRKHSCSMQEKSKYRHFWR